MARKILSTGTVFLALVILVGVFPKPVFAYQRLILGATTQAVNPQIPPTTEGPGLILPDSPFFFLDNLKQAVRLFLAFTPEAKAKAHVAIAGERLAELRFMLARQNESGIETDLKGISENLKQAVNDVTTAQLSGRNVSVLAKEVNDDIKGKQDTLDILESQAQGELKAWVLGTQTSLLEAKVKVEDALPQADLENEIRDDLNRQIEGQVKKASESAIELRDALNVLTKQATEAAQKSLKNREEALKRAINAKNDILQRTEKKLLEQEKAKQEGLLKIQGQAAEQARVAIAKAQEAALNFQKSLNEINKIQNQSVGNSAGLSGQINK